MRTKWIGIASLFILSTSIAKPVFGDLKMMLVSQEMEIAIGQKLAEEVKEKYGLVTKHPRLSAVQKIGKKLSALSTRAGINYSFEVIADPEPNAFACPGGPIFITQGLLDKLQTEAQLAAVLSHEFAHIERQHGRKEINKSLVSSLGMAIILKNANETIKTGVDIGWNLIRLGHSRDHEKEADREGIRYAARIGYNPSGMIELLQILGGEEHKGVVKYLATHPSTPDRIKAGKEQIAKEFSNQQFAASAKLPAVESSAVVVQKPEASKPEETTAQLPIGKETIFGKVEAEYSSLKDLRVALAGFPSGKPENGLKEIYSINVSSNGRFVINLPQKPLGYLPSPEYNGAFHIKLYRDKNQNQKKDEDEDWLGKSKEDFVLVWGQKTDSKNPQIRPGWNLAFFKLMSGEVKKIFHPSDFSKKEAWVIIELD